MNNIRFTQLQKNQVWDIKGGVVVARKKRCPLSNFLALTRVLAKSGETIKNSTILELYPLRNRIMRAKQRLKRSFFLKLILIIFSSFYRRANTALKLIEARPKAKVAIKYSGGQWGVFGEEQKKLILSERQLAGLNKLRALTGAPIQSLDDVIGPRFTLKARAEGMSAEMIEEKRKRRIQLLIQDLDQLGYTTDPSSSAPSLAEDPLQAKSPTGFRPIPFWKAMQVNQNRKTPDAVRKDPVMKTIKKHYDKYCSEVKKASSKEMQEKDFTIPRIAHFIWIGGPVPDYVNYFAKTVEEHNPGWDVKIWKNEDIWSDPEKKNLKFNFSSERTKKVFEEGKSWAEKVDVLRCEILNRTGGVYFDSDAECFASLDDLHSHGAEFYCGLEYNEEYRPGNAIIGAAPGHPIIKEMLNNMTPFSESPNNSDPLDILYRTGPRLLGQQIKSVLNKNQCKKGSVLVLPPVFLFPCPGYWTDIPMAKFVLPGTVAGHYFFSDWRGDQSQIQAAKLASQKMEHSKGSWNAQQHFGQIRVVDNPNIHVAKKRMRFNLGNIGLKKGDYKVYETSLQNTGWKEFPDWVKEQRRIEEKTRLINHYNAIKEVYEKHKAAIASGDKDEASKYGSVLILENSIAPGTLTAEGGITLYDLAEKFKTVVQSAPDNWEMISFMVEETYGKQEKTASPELASLGNPIGAKAYTLKASAYEKVLAEIEGRLAANSQNPSGHHLLPIGHILATLTNRNENPLITFGSVTPLFHVDAGKHEKSQPKPLRIS